MITSFLLQDIPRHRDTRLFEVREAFKPGLSSGPNFRLGTGSRGIEISRDSPGRDKKVFL